jgi:hypothetical protein
MKKTRLCREARAAGDALFALILMKLARFGG